MPMPLEIDRESYLLNVEDKKSFCSFLCVIEYYKFDIGCKFCLTACAGHMWQVINVPIPMDRCIYFKISIDSKSNFCVKGSCKEEWKELYEES